MPNVSTRPQVGATAPALQVRKALPIVSEPPMELTGLKALRDANAIAIHWWSTLEMISEQGRHAETRQGTVPQWVLDAIGDWRSQHAANDAHRALMERAGQALRIAGEGSVNLVYEVWTARGHRLDGQYEFRAEAEAALAGRLDKYPDAEVTRVHRRSPMFMGAVNVELLDTLVGRVFWAGCSFPEDGEEVHTVQDETGRCVCAPLSMLLEHPVLDQMTGDARARVAFSAEQAARKAQLRAAGEKGGA